MVTEEARYKMLKCRFNELCNAGVLLEDREATLFSGLSSVNVNSKSVDIQPSFNGYISLSTMNIKQPLAKQSNIPMDYLPGFSNISPRKIFDLPLIEEFGELTAITISIGVLLSK